MADSDFTVAVGGKQYDVRAPDEATAWKWARATHLQEIAGEGVSQTKPPKPFTPSGDKALSAGEEVLANPYGRALVGAAKPVIGIGQLGLNAVGQGEGINRAMTDLAGSTAKAREFVGSRGLDLADLTGQAASMAIPAGLIGPAATTTGRIGQGMLFGGATGAAETVPSTDNYWAQKAAQIGLGTLAGGVVPGLWEGSKAIGRGVRNVVQPSMGEWGERQAVGRLGNLVAGDKADEIINLMRNSQPIVPGSNPTAGQASVQANRPEFNAFQQIVEESSPTIYAGPKGIAGQQNAARLAAVDTIAGSPVEIEAAISARNKATKPMREQALANANLAGIKGPELERRLQEQQGSMVSALQDKGRFQTTAAQQDNLANNWVPVPGQPRAPGRYSLNAERVPEAQAAAADTAEIVAARNAQKGLTQYQLDSLAAHGQFPLKSGPVSSRIEATMSQPGLRASDVVQKTLGDIKKKIASLTDENGVIDARDLYTIRKEVGNTIETHAKETSNWDKRLTGGLERNIQRYIDDAIEGAGGTGWKDYLNKFAGASKEIDQMKMGGELRNKLTSPLSDDKQRAGVFAAAMRDMGVDLQKTMRPDQIETLRNVQTDLARDATAKDLARAGSKSAYDIVGKSVGEIPPTGVFNMAASMARGAYNRIAGGASEKTIKAAGQIMQNPSQMAEVMEKAKPFERQAIVDLLLRWQAGAAQDLSSEGALSRPPQRGALSK